MKTKETHKNTESTKVLNKALQKILLDLDPSIAKVRGKPLTATNETEEEQTSPSNKFKKIENQIIK